MTPKDRPLVFITQRVDAAPDRGERRDALDQKWSSLLNSIDCDAILAPNNPDMALSLMVRIRPSLLILSGGNDVRQDHPGHAPERNATEAALLGWAQEEKLPTLGVCRGFQFINLHFGGRLSPVSGHVAVEHKSSLASGPFTSVNSYHDYGIAKSELAPSLEILATATDGTIEAARHRTLPVIGVMWHPERAMPDADGSRLWLARLICQAAEERRISFDRE